MNISDIEFVPIRPRGGLLGFVEFIVNDAFFVGDVAVHSRLDGSGIRLVYPSKRLVTGKEINVFRPIRREVAEEIEGEVQKVIFKIIDNNLNKKCDEANNGGGR